MNKLSIKRNQLSEVKGASIKIPDTSIYEQFINHRGINASDILSRCHEDVLSINRLQTEVEIYARAFLKMGIKVGDIVPICLPPCNEGIITFFALNKIGAISSFMNVTSTKAELKKYNKIFKTTYMVISTKIVAEIGELIDQCKLKRVVVISPNDTFSDMQSLSDLSKQYIKNCAGIIKHDAVLTLKEFKELSNSYVGNISISIKKTMPAFIAYTSGSTGEPKAILLSNENIMAEMISLKKSTGMQFGPKKNSLQIVPFNYPYGFLISTLFPMFVGKTAALTPVLTMNNLAPYLKMYKPAYINGIPSFYISFYINEEIRKMDLSFLKYAVSGGDKFTIEEKRKLNEFFKSHKSTAKILDGSGNGEGCGSLTNPLSLFSGYNPESIGKPIHGLSVKFIDESGNIVGMGETGRFCFSGKNLMMEYFKQPEATAKVVKKDENGVKWFITDTFGHIDHKKWIYFDGRERRFFITYDSSGSPYKVYCDYVQEVIKKSGYVKDCAVVQKKSSERSLIPLAFICVDNPMNLDEKVKNINEYCSNRLQSCAAPVDYIKIDKIPLTVAGKVHYTALEEMAMQQEFLKSVT